MGGGGVGHGGELGARQVVAVHGDVGGDWRGEEGVEAGGDGGGEGGFTWRRV